MSFDIYYKSLARPDEYLLWKKNNNIYRMHFYVHNKDATIIRATIGGSPLVIS